MRLEPVCGKIRNKEDITEKSNWECFSAKLNISPSWIGVDLSPAVCCVTFSSLSGSDCTVLHIRIFLWCVWLMKWQECVSGSFVFGAGISCYKHEFLLTCFSQHNLALCSPFFCASVCDITTVSQ